MSKAVHRLAADGPYTISEDDLESLAVGSWILGTGGGGSWASAAVNERVASTSAWQASQPAT